MFRFCLFCLSVFLISCSTHNSKVIQSTENIEPTAKPEHLRGQTIKTQLLHNFSIFQKNYENYSSTEDQTTSVQSVNKPVNLLIVFGTWCHDSEREVPRLLKLIDTANNSKISYQLIAVGFDKKIPESLNIPFSIRYTPTVIVLDEQNNEIGRIIEKPTNGWAKDLVAAIKQQ